MPDILLVVFLALLACLVGSAIWLDLDPLYLYGFSVLILVLAAVADAGGSLPAADTLSEFAILVLGGGLVLQAVGAVRQHHTRPTTVAGVETPPLAH